MESPSADKLPAILNPDSASVLCECQPGTIEDALRAGELPGLKLGTGWILPTRVFIDRLNEMAVDQMCLRRAQKPAGAIAKAAIDKASERRTPPALPSLKGA